MVGVSFIPRSSYFSTLFSSNKQPWEVISENIWAFQILYAALHLITILAKEIAWQGVELNS